MSDPLDSKPDNVEIPLDAETPADLSPRNISIPAPPDAEGERLDLYLVSQFRDASRSSIQRAITGGDLTVNGRPVKPSHRLSAGDEIRGVIPESPPIEAVPENIPLNVVYEDAEVIVVNKPAGMVTHPGAGVSTGTLANALVYHLTAQSHNPPKRGGVTRPGIVHRLDVGTSGLVVVAKTDRAHLRLAEQFEARTISKRYLALAYGTVQLESGVIEAPIGRDPKNRVRMAVVPEGRPAITLYRVNQRFDGFTLLDLEIKTGRTHQIRVHLAHLKHPVVGDAAYGAGRSNSVKNPRTRAAIAKLSRPFLHASRLRFTHPSEDRVMEFEAPLPEELTAFLAGLAS